ncbi:MAG: glycosyltransferase [Vulcanimicrobiota bacterium]
MLTFLLPTRGLTEAPYFEEALASVLGQSCPRWRLLVLNGGPRPLALPSDERIASLEVWPRTGIAVALNLAMRAVKTPFVAVLHDDDRLHPEANLILLKAIKERPEIDYFHSARRFIDESGRVISAVYPPSASVSPQEFIERCPVKALHAWRVQPALSLGGIDEELTAHGGDDYDFPWRMAEAGARFGAIQECLYEIRDHRSWQRLTTDVPLQTQLDCLRRILSKHGIPQPAIEEQLQRRAQSYLRQALFTDLEDFQRKQESGFDRASGWRMRLRPPQP